MAIGQILRDFSGWTSAHGIPHIGSAQNWCLRIFWTTIVLTSVGMFSWQLYLLFVKFFKYDVNVAINLKFEERYFPAVTICNLNPYKYSVIMENETEPDFGEFRLLLSDYSLAIGSQPASGSDKFGLTGGGMNDTIQIAARARDQLVLLAAELERNNATLFNRLLYTKDDLIQNCAYNTAACNKNSTSSEDFSSSIDPVYGQCFTFNPKSPTPDYKSTRAGPLYGLRLLLMTNQTDYLPTTESAGVRVAVHGQGQDAFPDAFGYNAATGFTTSFGIKFVNTTRMQEPYGNCTVTTGIEDYYYDHYSVEGCFRSCFQRNIKKDCTCSDPRFAFENAGDGICDSTNIDCLAKFQSSAGFNAINECKCVPPCEKNDYGLTISTALWPSDVFVPADCKTPSPDYPSSWTTTAECEAWYRENTLLIEVYYERMNYQLLSESEAYEIINLVSDMGSQLGLWMGISIITVIEMVSLLVLLCFYGCTRKKGSVADEDDEDEEDE